MSILVTVHSPGGPVRPKPAKPFSISQLNSGTETRAASNHNITEGNLYVVFGTDPDRNRVTWETPSSEAIPFRQKAT